MMIGAISRSYHSNYDPLSTLNSDELYKNYRFTEEGIVTVTDLNKDDFFPIENDRGRPVSVQTAVLITLKYLASNTYQQAIAETFKLSQSTVSRCITAVVEKLADKAPQFIYFPRTAVEKRHSQKKFYFVRNRVPDFDILILHTMLHFGSGRPM